MNERKLQILFVDDEGRVLDGLRRSMRPMRHEWDTHYVETGKAALEFMESHPTDVIVSDMRMPEMDGTTLLCEVRDRWPEAVRIILSGHSERSSVLASVIPTHQFLAKPCEPELLKHAINRTYQLRNLLSDQSLVKLLSRVGTVPSAPQLYHRILEEAKAPDASMKRIGSIIRQDVGMSAKILQLVNSAFFGLPRHVDDPAVAASLLGLDIVVTLVLSIKVFSEFQEKHSVIDINELWQHSLTCATWAKAIAASELGEREIETGQAFIAGMLHDLGKLILAANLPDQYGVALEISEYNHQELWHAEYEVFGASHAQVGAYLMSLWGLPDSVVAAIAWHHDPGSSGEGGGFNPLTAVHIANGLITPSDKGLPIDMNYLKQIQCDTKLNEWARICSKLNKEQRNV